MPAGCQAWRNETQTASLSECNQAVSKRKAARSKKPAQATQRASRCSPFGLSLSEVRLNTLLQVVFGADGRIFGLRAKDFDVFVGLAEERQAVARALIFSRQRASDPVEV